MTLTERSPSHELHIPVLLDAVLDSLIPTQGETYLDLTAGYGGHARPILQKTGTYASSVLVDRDENALVTLNDLKEQGIRLVHDDFVSAARTLIEEEKQFDLILLDLGVSSPQLDLAERGFSFMRDGPLDMRMDRTQELTAEHIVNEYPEAKLSKIIHEYGEEPYGMSARYAHAICIARPLRTTNELATVITTAFGHRRGRIHPATKVFQALRLAVNDELGQIEAILPLLPSLLTTGGRAGIISFHSLEDRIVKRYLKDQTASGYEADLREVTKKPIDGATYDAFNPRSRSAKLRVAVKI